MADPAGRIVTAGGTSSWHDLAIHIISRHASPGEALHIAKVYLLKWHAEGQLPYASLVRRLPHADSAVRLAETWLAGHFAEADPVAGVVAACGIPERSLKRRFKTATGSTLIEYAQNLRVESAKRLLETSESPVDEVAASVGYENAAFFRRLFKRSTGLTPGDYRRMFRPFAMVGSPIVDHGKRQEAPDLFRVPAPRASRRSSSPEKSSRSSIAAAMENPSLFSKVNHARRNLGSTS